MKAKFIAIALLAAAIQPADAANVSIQGRFVSPVETISVQRTNISGQYRITVAGDANIWESVGFYYNDCACIKAVFRYLDTNELNQGATGYHRFDYKERGNKIIKHGGWDAPNEFEPIVFSREK